MVFVPRREFSPRLVSCEDNTQGLVALTTVRLDNGTGAPAGWNWILSLLVMSFSHGIELELIEHLISLFTAGTMTGFDASGHIAEETKNAR